MLTIAGVLLSLKEEPSSAPERASEGKKTEASIYQLAGDKNINDISPEFFPVRNWLVDEPEILAKSAIILNFKPASEKGNVLYQKNPNQVLPVASLTKIMTAIVVLENFNPDEVIKVSKNSITITGDKGGLIRDEELKVKDLLYVMLMESSNDAAMSLTEDNHRLVYNEFINLINSKVGELGLKNTSFVDPTGLSADNQSTVLEIADLTKYAFKFPLILEILKTPETTISSIDNKFIHNLTTTNNLLGKIPQIIGGKTGYTEEAGGCMLTVSNISNNYLITVILASPQREDDTEKLINWVQQAWLWQ
jgi:D-alanyl-D-alanine carboxypeptidase